MLGDDHPVDAELVGQHAKMAAPEYALDGHLGDPAGGQRVIDAPRFLDRGQVEGKAEALETVLAMAAVRGEQDESGALEACMKDTVPGPRRSGGLGGRVRISHQA